MKEKDVHIGRVYLIKERGELIKARVVGGLVYRPLDYGPKTKAKKNVFRVKRLDTGKELDRTAAGLYSLTLIGELGSP
jgi:hypothetical protein